MAMRNSSLSPPGRSDSMTRIKVRRAEGSQIVVEDGPMRKSMNIADAFEHEKAMAQAYREKNERNIMKCKFLYHKLAALGNMEGVPEMIATEVSEVDAKIKELQQALTFKRSQQMKKLRKKVGAFLLQINFEVEGEDLEKIEDEIELILFLMDVFTEKFTEMTAERAEIDEIIGRLEQDQTAGDEELLRQNQELVGKVNALEDELFRIREELTRETHIKEGLVAKSTVRLVNSQPAIPQDAEEVTGARNAELEECHIRVSDLEAELQDLRKRYRVKEVDAERAKKEEAKWRQRYGLMEAQKDERIRMLVEANRHLPK